MRWQVWPRSSQVPSPRAGMRAPLASTYCMVRSAISYPKSVPFGRLRRRADDAPVRPLEVGDLGHLGVRQCEVEYCHIFCESFLLRGTRDRHDALLNQPAQRHLAGALAVCLADALERGVARRLAARDRAIGGDGQAVAADRAEDLGLIEVGMHFELLVDQRLLGEPRRLVEQRDVEVGDADMLRLALALDLVEERDRLAERHARARPVDQQEIDPRHPELLEALVNRALEVDGAELVPPDLRREEHVLALDPGGAQALSHFALIAVHLRGVEMAPARLERGADDVDAQRLFQGHSSEPDRRNAGAVRLHVLHRCFLRRFWRMSYSENRVPLSWTSAGGRKF